MLALYWLILEKASTYDKFYQWKIQRIKQVLLRWFNVPEIVNTLLNGKGKIVCQERLAGY
jgi:hypothetical protein